MCICTCIRTYVWSAAKTVLHGAQSPAPSLPSIRAALLYSAESLQFEAKFEVISLMEAATKCKTRAELTKYAEKM